MGINPKRIDDMEIYSTITALNKFPFVQTSKCCKGHPEKLTTGNEINGVPYVLFGALDEKGILLANEIYETIRNNFENKPNTHLSININTRPNVKISAKYLIPGIDPAKSIVDERYKIREILFENPGLKEALKNDVEYFWESFQEGIENFKGKHNI